MAKARSRKASPAKAASARPEVAIIGGGIAGLSAALRLAQRGFAVTVFEAKPELGGNMSSTTVHGIDHDVYPHMFCDWYANFWTIFEQDLGFARATHFEPQDGVKLLELGAETYLDLRNPSTLATVWENLTSGILSVPEMIVLMFSMLDLAAYPFGGDVTDNLERIDVNGFLYSRGYVTEDVAKVHNYILTLVWSMNSDVTAAKTYQDFLRHFSSFPNEQPLAWLLRGSLRQKIVQPLADKLRDLGVTVHTETMVTALDIIDGRPRLTVEARNGVAAPQPFDNAIIATPAGAMIRLAMGAPGEDPATKIVAVEPRIAQLQHFRDAAIPVVDIYFKKKLAGVPQGQIGLKGSPMMLSVIDISQLWETSSMLRERTALVLAASDAFAIPAVGPEARGFAMIEQLHRWLPIFNPGKHWGDPDSDIEWAMSHFRANDTNRLFIDDVTSWAFRPTAGDPAALPNIFLAGDYCQSSADMATIEAAVQTGLLAAQALQAADARSHGKMRGEPITLAVEQLDGGAKLLAAKLALLPAAYGASAWAALSESLANPGGERPGTENYPLLLPLSYTLDWWKTAYSLALQLAPELKSASLADAGKTTLLKAADLLQDFARRQPGRGDPRPPPSELATTFSAFAGAAMRAAEAALTKAARGKPPAPDAPYKRRWRVKP
ncbi:MAG: hypothetical protein DCF31_08085 [Alphaproteobacteria bacterium]|nr:MAG: hypothetical protein DCF31_08085 [Alphaproteobacteria bacterium]